ncbi:hypothetical protein GGR28_003434 [Lewinella aquimaris]|uniref:Uncharacterized protein n=1 Tax=Neolewinella aquimaris TaxID=1835722 RepID=A0A840EG65_9BACT|nr:hypothetical protein [Neolewinella aquimaris]MBB4080799.1 hypothetical protein [Neolewinella aquimaris]
MLYLKLTCFDKLGQPAEYMLFNNWIKSKKAKEERAIILSELNGLSVENSAEALYNYYLKIYGVKNSFYRFITEVLPHGAKRQLLDAINIKVHSRVKSISECSYNIREINDTGKNSLSISDYK